MATNTNNPRPRGTSVLLKSCLVITVLVLSLFIVAVIYLARMPSITAITVCQDHMQKVAAAIDRYAGVTGHRPPNLDALRKEYLKDPSVLRCPLDKSPGDAPSYAYDPKAKDDQPMLECDRHRLRRDMPKSKLRVLGSGEFVIVNPSFKEVLKNAEKSTTK